MNTIFNFKGYKFIDNDSFKSIHGKDFNLYYDKNTGYAERWGKTRDDKDDPLLSRLGPTIMDVELCKDIKSGEEDKYVNEVKMTQHTCLGKCPMCYKSNSFTQQSHYMSLLKFKHICMKLANTHVKINDKLVYFNDDIKYEDRIIKAIDYPELNWETDICNCSPLLQFAFGITNLTTNPELLQIFAFCNKLGLTPNVTMHGKDEVSDEFLRGLGSMCGALSVSLYDKDKTYNFIERLHYAGARQLNMHLLVSEETFPRIMETFKDIHTDTRLRYLTSVILLFLKQRGRGTGFHVISQEHANQMFKMALDNDIKFGFDICCTHRFQEFVQKYKSSGLFVPTLYDFCDSSRFSGYVNTLGEYCPCSFIENNGMWLNGPNVFECNNFIDDIWNGKLQEKYRSILIGRNMHCLYYDV